MSVQVLPLALPPSADPSKFAEFGREVKGVHPGKLTPEQFKEISDLLYKVQLFNPPPQSTYLIHISSIVPSSSVMSTSHLRSSMP